MQFGQQSTALLPSRISTPAGGRSARRSDKLVPTHQMHPRVAEELIAFRKFWNDPVSLWRSTPALENSTCSKHVERIHQFLSFTFRTPGHEQDVSLAQVADLGLVQEYLRYLQDKRQVSHATMGQHVASIIAGAKFLIAVPHALVPSVPDPQLLLTRLRASQASLQRAGEHDRQMRKTSDETLSRMLDWSAVISLRERLWTEVTSSVDGLDASDFAEKAMFLVFIEVRFSWHKSNLMFLD